MDDIRIDILSRLRWVGLLSAISLFVAGACSKEGRPVDTTVAATPPATPAPSPSQGAKTVSMQRSSKAKRVDDNSTSWARVVIDETTDNELKAYGIAFVLKDGKIDRTHTVTGILEAVDVSGSSSQETLHEIARVPMAAPPTNPDPNNLLWPGPTKSFAKVNGRFPKIRMTTKIDGFDDAVCTIDPAAANPVCEEGR